MALRLTLTTRVKHRIAMADRLIHRLDTLIVILMHVAGVHIIPRRVVGMSIDTRIPSRVAGPSTILNGG
jgi:hypothetical protein